MSEIVEIKLSPDQIEDELQLKRALKQKKKSSENIHSYRLIRKSLDSRQRNIYFVLRYELFFDGENPPNIVPTEYQQVDNSKRVIVVGAGPAGYFAALKLLEQGIKPIVLDRGKDVQARRRDLRNIQQKGIVNPHSNYCFGEGGAGTYSDGKLYTRSHKRGNIQGILQTLYHHGAHERVLYDAHPHIGSNKLPGIVAELRNTIIRYGGEVHFDAFVVDFKIEKDVIQAVILEDGASLEADAVVLATGHSARDIYLLLQERGIIIEAKDFAIGVRIEHPQGLIDQMQYRQNPRHCNLPAASYRLSTEIDGKGVFSFCMCPGGLIVPASTAPGELVVNGMSLSRRDSPFSNSGFVTAVNHVDFHPFRKHGVLAGMYFQQAIEQKFWSMSPDGSQQAPAQRVPDFLKSKGSSSLLDTSYIPGIYSGDLCELLPASVTERIQAGLRVFGRRYPSYISEEAQLIGIESRTSSPIRIPRVAKTAMHPQIKGLFPCGEGAGYAGGILSACMDGEFVANKVGELLLTD